MTPRPCTCDRTGDCRLCWLWAHDSRYRELWGGEPGDVTPGTWQGASAPARTALCVHLGPQSGFRECVGCGGKTRLKAFGCNAGHGDVTLPDCRVCPDYVPARE